MTYQVGLLPSKYFAMLGSKNLSSFLELIGTTLAITFFAALVSMVLGSLAINNWPLVKS